MYTIWDLAVMIHTLSMLFHHFLTTVWRGYFIHVLTYVSILVPKIVLFQIGPGGDTWEGVPAHPVHASQEAGEPVAAEAFPRDLQVDKNMC